jgi:hypothetical protein
LILEGPRALPDAQPDMNADDDVVAHLNSAESLAVSRAFLGSGSKCPKEDRWLGEDVGG